MMIAVSFLRGYDENKWDNDADVVQVPVVPDTILLPLPAPRHNVTGDASLLARLLSVRWV